MENLQILRVKGADGQRMQARRRMPRPDMPSLRLVILGLFLVFCTTQSLIAQQKPKQQWKTLPFAIVRYNDDAPKSWNVYRGDRKGIYLVRLWKRYLLIDTLSQSAFEIDPAKVKAVGESAELAPADIPDEPIDS